MHILFLSLFLLSAGDEEAEKILYIHVRVWGEVRNPGIYRIPPNSDVIDAISYAGGPRESADLGKVKLIKGTRAGEIKYVDVGGYLKGKKIEIPFVEQGDIIYVGKSTGYKIYEFLRGLAVFAGIVAVVYQVFGKEGT
ncbi:hypothetical protein DRQ18_03065 [bacterium]|nr:MAG: hypothetical protein DRQ18_03065 [bacterium]